MKPLEQFLGAKRALDHDNRVEIGVLIGATDGLGLIDARDPDDLSQVTKCCNRSSHVVDPGAEVAAKGDGVSRHLCLTTVTATSSNATGMGA
jgi:hypothetical protein